MTKEEEKWLLSTLKDILDRLTVLENNNITYAVGRLFDVPLSVSMDDIYSRFNKKK